MKPGFTGSPLERLDHERDHDDVIAARKANADARLLMLDGLSPATDASGALRWGRLSDAPAGADLAMLGEIDGVSRFVVLDPNAAGGMNPAMFGILSGLPDGEAATYATARSLVDWHARHAFCAKCAAPTKSFRAGWARKCGDCGTEHFPRTDPVVIMLAEHDGAVLVGRQPRFPPKFYSALAGFVEVGESMEEAVARELFEEAGVRATSVRYMTSQPWPFPSQLMMACIAPVESRAITLDTNELEEAIWVTRDEVRAALAGAADARFSTPPPHAIAHTLLSIWSA